MMLTRSHARSIGWAAILAVCFALTVALSFRVNAVKSQVRLTERHIAQIEAETGLLETEFETRANQQQLTALNEVEFGYQAPTPGQYLESERQLASLGKPRGPDAPPMIRVAAADAQPASQSVLPAMVNPLTGKALAAELPRPEAKAKTPAKGETKLAERAPANLAERLARVEPAQVEKLAHIEKSPKVIVKTGEAKPAKLAKAEAKPAGKSAAKPAKAEPKLAKAEVKAKPAKTEAKLAKAEPKAKPAKAEPKVAKAAPAKPTRVAAKPHAKGDRVAFD